MAKARKTAEQIVDKQVRAAQNAVQDYTQGVQAVQTSPNQIAAGKVDKYRDSVMAAIQSGKYQAAQAAVTLQDWKGPTLEKGARNYAPGVAAARPKLLKFQREYGPVRDSITDQVRSMPNDTFEERMARAAAMARALHDAPYKK